MKQTLLRHLVLVAALGLSSLALAQKTAPGDDPSWTGVTKPKDVIEAREALMVAVESLMGPCSQGYNVDDTT